MTHPRQLEITKANGDKTVFESTKLQTSLLRSGAQPDEAYRIAEIISSELYPGISTRTIYKKAFKLLKEKSRYLAARYNLKNAIMQLGPSGFPFEKFIAALLTHQGYTVLVDQIVEGKCVSHEVDIIAKKGDRHFLIECKYHNQAGTLSDVKTPLYIQARFQDINYQQQKPAEDTTTFQQGWVVTNTRFTQDALRYGNCAGLKLLGWDYPAKGSLKDMIDTLGLYPVTTLTSLTASEKKALLERKIVLCMEIRSNEMVLQQLGLKATRIQTVLKECDRLCERAIQLTINHNLL